MPAVLCTGAERVHTEAVRFEHCNRTESGRDVCTER